MSLSEAWEIDYRDFADTYPNITRKIGGVVIALGFAVLAYAQDRLNSDAVALVAAVPFLGAGFKINIDGIPSD